MLSFTLAYAVLEVEIYTLIFVSYLKYKVNIKFHMQTPHWHLYLFICVFAAAILNRKKVTTHHYLGPLAHYRKMFCIRYVGTETTPCRVNSNVKVHCPRITLWKYLSSLIYKSNALFSFTISKIMQVHRYNMFSWFNTEKDVFK